MLSRDYQYSTPCRVPRRTILPSPAVGTEYNTDSLGVLLSSCARQTGVVCEVAHRVALLWEGGWSGCDMTSAQDARRVMLYVGVLLAAVRPQQFSAPVR